MAAPTADPSPEIASGPAVIVEYGESGRPEIALTFDAGADLGYAEEILDLLQAEGITANFGIMGQWAENHPDLVQRMVDEGHMLFNHSWSHPSFTGVTTSTEPLPYQERWQEVEQTDQIVREITGYEMKPYFRPPYGDMDPAGLGLLGEMGYTRVLNWSCDSRDSLGASGEEILTNCIYNARPGRIVLLHVGGQSAAYSVLPQIIASLREQGFTFVTADQILQP